MISHPKLFLQIEECAMHLQVHRVSKVFLLPLLTLSKKFGVLVLLLNSMVNKQVYTSLDSLNLNEACLGNFPSKY
jgi:hypothetical protein